MLVQEISEELFDEIIDSSSYNSRKLNKHLRSLKNDHKKILIKNPHSLHFIAAGCIRDIDLIINGSVGYYPATCGDKLRMHVYGNGGWYVGDNMTSGTLIVEGDVGDGVAQGNYGAKVIIKGDATARTAQLHKRGMLIVGGKTSSMTGLFMMGGTIIILGDSGTNTGEMIVGGEIFVAGEIESLGKNAKIVEPTSDDLEMLRKQLSVYDFDIDYNFKKVVPETRRPFYNPLLHESLSIKRNMPTYNIKIRQDLCSFCKACVRNCPVNVFEADEENEKIIPVKEVECVKCEYCIERCPKSAIRIQPVPPDFRNYTWRTETVDRILQEASNGMPLVRGTGAHRIVPNFDDLVVMCAQTSRPPIDSYREPCRTDVVLGSRFAENPLKLDIPVLFGAMSYGALSKEAKMAIAMAARELKTATNTGEGGMLPEEREIAPIVISQYASGRFGVSAQYLQCAEAVEIKIGQGAKAGMGGHLPAEKVTFEIAGVRKIPPGTDALSPARNLDIVGPEDLKIKIEQLREITDWKVPIIVKYAPGRQFEDAKIAAKAGADIILIDGMQGGTGAAPIVATEHAGIPTLPALVTADRALRELGLRDEVNLIISGGIRYGADLAKALALGADAVAICTGALIAMGCRVCGLCSTGNCPWGITTQILKLRKRLDSETAAKRVINYIHAIVDEACTLAQIAGKTHIRHLEWEDLRALSYDAAAIAGVKLAGTDDFVSDYWREYRTI